LPLSISTSTISQAQDLGLLQQVMQNFQLHLSISHSSTLN